MRHINTTAPMLVSVLYLFILSICSANVYGDSARPVGLQFALRKIESRVSLYNHRRIETNRRSLVIYHIGNLDATANSVDVATNNVKIFVSAVELHSRSAQMKAFYLFNIVGQNNPLAHLVPTTQVNVAMLQWNSSRSDLDTHLYALKVLGENVTSSFGTVIFANQGVRGPIVYRDDGRWIERFTRAMAKNNVGMFGPTISCEISPHVQTHMFALRTSLIPIVLEDMQRKMETQFKSWQDLITSLEVGLTGVVVNAGYNVSSFMHQRHDQPYFRSCLNDTAPPHRFSKNPACWCNSLSRQLVFVKWGGELMRTAGMLCNSTILQMEIHLDKLHRKNQTLQLAVPEVYYSGPMHSLFQEYAQEAWIDRHPVLLPDMDSAAVPAAVPAAAAAAAVPAVAAPAVAVPGSKVCFLVRVTQPLHAHRRYENSYSPLINKELELLITTLRRQSNPNWLAMIYRIDNKPIHGEIADLVSSFDDSRLKYDETDIGAGYKYSSQDAGYTVTDKYLKRALQRPECQWISVTTSDNAYGSEVVNNVLSRNSFADVDMVVVPMDSRRYQQKDIIDRSEPYCSFLPNLISAGSTSIVDQSSSHHLDLAGVFLKRDKLIKETIHFGDFSDRSKFPCVDTAEDSTDPPGYLCLNAQGAHLLHHLSSSSQRSSRWTLARLPVDGLKSVVFHGNSPTLCIGAGNTWLDHPDPSQRRCMTGRDTLDILDHPAHQSFMYDKKHYAAQKQSFGVCMRVLEDGWGVTSTLGKVFYWFASWFS